MFQHIKSTIVPCIEPQPSSPSCSLAQMAPARPLPTPPPGVAEYLALLAQSGSLPGFMVQDPTPPVSTPVPSLSSLPAESRAFTRVGRGQGGALTQKQAVSKQITAPATKRKSLVDSDLELHSPDPTGKGPARKSVKRVKTAKVRTFSSFLLPTEC